MGGSGPSLESWLEGRVEALGFELVELERAGNETRPIFRLRIDRPEGVPGAGVTLDDCAKVSRDLEPDLDARDDISPRYVIEVSSPGIERPLVRRRDWERFAGHPVAVKSRVPIEGHGKRVEGDLLGLAGEEDAERVRLRCDDELVEIPLADVQRAHLVHRWDS